MSENLRATYRVWPEEELVAELLHDGRVHRCDLVNLSAGGALVLVGDRLALDTGDRCTLCLRLRADLSGRTGESHVRLPVEVLERSDHRGSPALRLRSSPQPGSRPYEATAKLVFEAQRQQRARESGSNIASPMVSDRERRIEQRPSRRRRFGKGSLRPDGDT